MTECNGLPLLFSGIGHKKIEADFQGGNLTSPDRIGSGLPLLREVDRKIGLIDALNAAIYDPRFQPLVVHDQCRCPSAYPGPADSPDRSGSPPDTRTSTITRPCGRTPCCRLSPTARSKQGR